MINTFKKLPKILQIILLLIPGVNEITELIVRWVHFVEKPTAMRVLVAILCFPFGVLIGWIDLVVLLLNGSLILED